MQDGKILSELTQNLKGFQKKERSTVWGKRSKKEQTDSEGLLESKKSYRKTTTKRQC